MNAYRWCFVTLPAVVLLSVSRALVAQTVCETSELAVGRASGLPGEQVDVEVVGEVSCEITGFSMGIGHDPERILFVDAVPGAFLLDHAGPGLFFQVDGQNESGYAIVGAIFDISFPLTVPPTRLEPGTVLAILTYEIRPDARPGTVPLLNRTMTYGSPTNRVSNIYSGKPGEPPIEPALTDGAVAIEGNGTLFLRGDANADGRRDIADGVYALLFLFLGGSEPPCFKSADANDTGRVDLSDPVFLLNYLFRTGDAPPEPTAACGVDPTEDGLTCESYTRCPRT